MSYSLYLRAVIHQGTDRKLMEKKDKEYLTWCLCVLVWSRGMCVYVFVCGGIVMQVFVSAFTQKHHIVSFFSSPLDFPPLGRELYFRRHRIWKYPSCWGKSIKPVCSLYRNKFSSHTTEGVPFFLSVFV